MPAVSGDTETSAVAGVVPGGSRCRAPPHGVRAWTRQTYLASQSCTTPMSTRWYPPR